MDFVYLNFRGMKVKSFCISRHKTYTQKTADFHFSVFLIHAVSCNFLVDFFVRSVVPFTFFVLSARHGIRRWRHFAYGVRPESLSNGARGSVYDPRLSSVGGRPALRADFSPFMDAYTYTKPGGIRVIDISHL